MQREYIKYWSTLLLTTILFKSTIINNTTLISSIHALLNHPGLKTTPTMPLFRLPKRIRLERRWRSPGRRNNKMDLRRKSMRLKSSRRKKKSSRQTMMPSREDRLRAMGRISMRLRSKSLLTSLPLSAGL